MVARGASVENSLTKLPDVFVAKKTSEIIEFTHAELCLPTKTSITNIYICIYIYIGKQHNMCFFGCTVIPVFAAKRMTVLLTTPPL
jgi:hypothetical protein